MDPVGASAFEFADVHLDLARREVSCAGRVLDLQPRVFDLLAYFAAHPRRVIGRDELIHQVWGLHDGSDAMVARAVMKIRRALDDEHRPAPLIRTVLRVGYRLDADVRSLGPGTGQPVMPPETPGRPGDPAAPHLRFWEDQLARASALMRQGRWESALSLINECAERLPPSPRLRLMHADVLRYLGHREEAAACMREARELAAAEPDRPELLAGVMFQASMHAMHSKQIGEASRLIQQAVAAAEQVQGPCAVMPAILAFHASLKTELGEDEAAIALAERAIAAAMALGDRAKEAHARVVLGRTLLYAGETHRADEVLRRAVDTSAEQGLLLVESYAWLVIAARDEAVGRHASAMDASRRSAALAASGGDLTLRDSARVHEMIGLVHAGHLQQAQELSTLLEPTIDAAWENRSSLGYARALLLWRLGEGRQAEALMAKVAAELRPLFLRASLVSQLAHCLFCVSLDDIDKARTSARLLQDSGAVATALAGQAQAALSLATGQREACKAWLTQAVVATRPGTADRLRASINLAWLMLEDGQTQDASGLIAQVYESDADMPAARLVVAAYQLRQHRDAVDAAQWTALVRAAPRLAERFPVLLASDARSRWHERRLDPLPELLTQACD